MRALIPDSDDVHDQSCDYSITIKNLQIYVGYVYHAHTNYIPFVVSTTKLEQ